MIRVDHVGVPARARLDAAGLLASLFGLDPEIPDDGRFARLPVSPEFTIVFYDSEQTQSTHVAFVVDDDAFDAILRQLQFHGVAYGSQPHDRLTVERACGSGAPECAHLRCSRSGRQRSADSCPTFRTVTERREPRRRSNRSARRGCSGV
jgi:hypothetical protein